MSLENESSLKRSEVLDAIILTKMMKVGHATCLLGNNRQVCSEYAKVVSAAERKLQKWEQLHTNSVWPMGY